MYEFVLKAFHVVFMHCTYKDTKKKERKMKWVKRFYNKFPH